MFKNQMQEREITINKTIYGYCFEKESPDAVVDFFKDDTNSSEESARNEMNHEKEENPEWFNTMEENYGPAKVFKCVLTNNKITEFIFL